MPPQSRKVGIQADPALAASVFDTIDLNRNGKISWEELWAAARPDVTDVLQALHQQSLSIERLLRENDSSGDGALSFSEFQKLLMRLHMEVDQETATEVFKRLDADGDQQLSLKTFLPGRDSPAGALSPSFWTVMLITCLPQFYFVKGLPMYISVCVCVCWCCGLCVVCGVFCACCVSCVSCVVCLVCCVFGRLCVWAFVCLCLCVSPSLVHLEKCVCWHLSNGTAFCIPRLLKIGLKILLWFSLGVQRLDNEGFGMRTFSL